MINSKLEKNIKLGFGIVIFILGIISFIILPNKVGMQISVSGKLQNYMPKIIAVIIPIGCDWRRFYRACPVCFPLSLRYPCFHL